MSVNLGRMGLVHKNWMVIWFVIIPRKKERLTRIKCH